LQRLHRDFAEDARVCNLEKGEDWPRTNLEDTSSQQSKMCF
jgi:hypothetical protein